MKRIAGICLILALLCGPALAAGPVLIVNPGVNIDSLDSKTIRYIFLGKKTSWDGGMRVIPVALEGGPVHKEFLKTYVRQTPSQFSTHWKRMTFTGKAEEIKTFQSEADLTQFVATQPGAVGYVGDTAPAIGVKVVPVE
ncbi:MAG: hypothetical protein JEZ02_00440 [Desulfatibacillum sp.]|nr:hypothetical protein [Desulfatibacillum sp.]